MNMDNAPAYGHAANPNTHSVTAQTVSDHSGLPMAMHTIPLVTVSAKNLGEEEQKLI
jgi:hypothetical protein